MQTSPSTGYRAYVLFILVVVYTFNFIDRQIVGTLAIPIKEELGLSDIPLSLMGGLAFALFLYFTSGRLRACWRQVRSICAHAITK